MSLKFDIREDMGGYALHVDTAQTNIEIGATEAELRRLLVDLLHEFEDVDLYDSEETRRDVFVACGWCHAPVFNITRSGTMKTVKGSCENCDGANKWVVELKEVVPDE